jgi:hypothetical protein
MTYTATSLVNADGSINGPIIIGDDYLHTNSRSFQWTIPAISGFTLGACTCFFGGQFKTHSFLVQGTVVDATGGNWFLRFDVRRDDTEDLQPGMYRYSVEVRHADNEVTRVYYDCLVRLSEKLTNIAASGLVIDGGSPSSIYSTEVYDGGSP